MLDEFDAVGMNVSAKLRKMDSIQQALAESLINKILTKGVFKELTRLTDVTENIATNNSLSWQATLSNTNYVCSPNSTNTSSSSSQPSPQPVPSNALLCNYYSDVAQDISYNNNM